MAKREQGVAEAVEQVEETMRSIAHAQAEYEELMEEIRNYCQQARELREQAAELKWSGRTDSLQELATFVIDEQTINYLRQINLEFSKAMKESYYYSALKLDEQYHRGIIEITDNPYISNTLSTLQAHVRRLFFHNSYP